MQPLAALGVALRAAGHEALLAAPAEMRGLADQAGLPFRSLGGGLRQLAEGELLPRNWAGGVVALWHTFSATLRTVIADTAEATLAASEGADHVVASGFQFLAASAAERRGIPYTYVALAPVAVRSSAYPPVPLAHLRTGRLVNRLGWRGVEAMASSALRPGLNAARRALGLPPTRNVLAHVIFNQPALLAFSRHVCPPAPDWPARHHQTGYWRAPATGGDPTSAPFPSPALERFLASGPPPVYVGFGSMQAFSREPLRLLRLVVEAAHEADARVVVGGRFPGLGGEAREGSRVLLGGDVPHDWLFPRVAAVVHHGGAGTTASGLLAGRPTLVVPHLGDQFFWGRRVHELGVGPRPLPVRQLNPARLARALRSLLDDADARQRAADLAERLAADDGAERAAALLAGA